MIAGILQAFVAVLMSVHPTLEGSDMMVTRLVSVEATCCSGTAGFEVHVRNRILPWRMSLSRKACATGNKSEWMATLST